MNKEKADKIFILLERNYPNAKIILNYSNNWELLVSVILSAQSTDKKVNEVTSKLFKKYKSVEDYANADIEEFEKDIHSTGFYRSKSKYIINSAKKVLSKFNGKIPKSMVDLTSLPGVARKTANIIQGNAFGIIEGIAVDTHVKRLSNRIGFSNEKNPEKIEKDLMELFNKKKWFKLTYLLIEHGRKICDAKKPKCDKCFLNKICKSAFNFDPFK